MPNVYIEDMNKLTKTHKIRYLAAVRLVVVAVLIAAAAVAARPAPASAGSSLVYIEPGHGANTGAYSSPGAYYEDTINLDIALRLNDLLVQNGYPTFMARTDNSKSLSGSQEDVDMDQANAMGAGVFISIHNNSSTAPSAGGTETWYYPVSNSGPFASLVHTNMLRSISNFGYNVYDRGIKIAPNIPASPGRQKDIWMIDRAQMPAALIEGLFVSNPTEAILLLNPLMRQSIAGALFDAIRGTIPAGSTVQFPLFQWNKVTGATDYEIELLTQMPAPGEITGTGHSQFAMAHGVTMNEFWPGDTRGLKAGTYYWRVIARDAGHNPIGLYTAAKSFEVPKPTISPKLNGQSLQTQYPSFGWSAVQGATSYGIELLNAPPTAGEANTTAASVHRIAVGMASATTYKGDIRGLKPGTYYYRIISWNGNGFVGGFSDYDSFTVPKPTITNPIGGATLTSQFPRFTWLAVPGATSYGLELLRAAPTAAERNGNTASVNRIAAGLTTGTAWNGDIRGMGAGIHYYRVIAANAAGLLGGFSDTDFFVVPKPTLQAIDWSGGETAPKFRWNAVDGATGYGIELLNAPPENPNDASPSVHRIAATLTGANTFFQGSTAGLLSGTYYYRIIATNQNGLLGGFSDAVAFSVSQKITVSSIGGPYNIVDQNGTVLANALTGSNASVSYAGGVYRITSPTGYSTSTASYIRFIPVSPSTVLQVLNMPEYNSYRGAIEVRFSAASGKLWAINELDLESYVRGMGEEPETWPGGGGEPVGNATQYQEFLNLSSVAFRSYAYDVAVKKNKHPGEPFDLCNEPDSCQWYIGYSREMQGNNLSAAANATAGQVVIDNGAPVRVPYFSDCSGRTLSAAEKGWNYPFCNSVSDAPFCTGHVQRGHGVGICMNGARWRAASGVDYSSIIHYYLAVDPGFGNIGNPTVRVALFSLNAQ